MAIGDVAFDVEANGLIDSVPATLRCWHETLRAFEFDSSST